MAEGKLFNCPSCGAALSPEGDRIQVKCSYCGNQVMVPEEFRRTAAPVTTDANPVSITIDESGTKIQVSDYAALQRNSIELSEMMTPEILTSPWKSNWVKFSIWMFVIFTLVTFVIPFACSICGMLAGLVGAFVPFFAK